MPQAPPETGGNPSPGIGNRFLWRPLTQHRRGSSLHGLSDKGVTVCGEASHGHKKVPGLGGSGVIADLPNLQIQIRCGKYDRDPCKSSLSFMKFVPFLISGAQAAIGYYRQLKTPRIQKMVPETIQNLLFVNPIRSCLQTELSPLCQPVLLFLPPGFGRALSHCRRTRQWSR